VLDRVECPGCRWSGNTIDVEKDDSCPKCGETTGRRADDTAEHLHSRHEEFSNITGPVIEWYRAEALLHTIDATTPPDEVAAALLANLLATPAAGACA